MNLKVTIPMTACVVLLLFSCYSSKTTYKQKFDLYLKAGDALLMVDDRQDYEEIYADLSSFLAANNVSFTETTATELGYRQFKCQDAFYEMDTACLGQIAEISKIDYVILSKMAGVRKADVETDDNMEDGQVGASAGFGAVSIGSITFEVWDVANRQKMVSFDVETKSKGITVERNTMDITDPNNTLGKARKEGVKELQELIRVK